MEEEIITIKVELDATGIGRETKYVKTNYSWFPYKDRRASVWIQSEEKGGSVLLTKILKSLRTRSILLGLGTQNDDILELQEILKVILQNKKLIC